MNDQAIAALMPKISGIYDDQRHKYTQVLIAGCMSGCDPVAYALLRYHLFREKDYYSDVYAAGLNHLGRVAVQQEWQIEKMSKGRLSRLIDLGLLELVSDTVCKCCKGVGYKTIDNERRKCPRCRGTGQKGMSERKKARLANIDQKSWFSVWQSRYNMHVYNWLVMTEMKAFGHLHHALYD